MRWPLVLCIIAVTCQGLLGAPWGRGCQSLWVWEHAGVQTAKCSVSCEAGTSTEANVASVGAPTRHGYLLHWQDADHDLPEYGLLGLTVVDTDDWEKHCTRWCSCHHPGAGMYVNSS